MANTFVCVSLVENVCQQWAVAMGLPPLTVEEGLLLGSKICAVYIAAWGSNILVRLLLNKW